MVHQVTAILEAAKPYSDKGAFAAVMVHDMSGRRLRQEDELAAAVVREMRSLGFNAAVLHSSIGAECYSWKNNEAEYKIHPQKRSRMMGYLRGVTLNTVLLNNYKWPFILSSPTHADVTIGIDVKHNTAGLVIVGNNGSSVRFFSHTTTQKERLDSDHIRAWLVELLTQEAKDRPEPLRVIVLHRDGRVFESERLGARQALALLKKKGIVAEDATLTILAIPKQSPAPLRLYDRRDQKGHRPSIENPQVGCYYLAGENDGYLCATGRAFPHPGTVRPLHVQRIEGDLPLEKCLQDIYALTVLAWTRPQDCTRYPITIKLNDRFLGAEATRYDVDALNVYDPDVEDNGDENNDEGGE
jgi:argonaute-like protein implicated in RNA metabolism and viral defense